MILPEAAFNAYDAALRRQAEEAAQKLAAFIDTLDFSGDYYAKKEARNQVIAYMQELAALYGDAAATLAADLYNEMAEESGTKVPDAELAERVVDEAIASSVRYHAKHLWGGSADVEAFKRGALASLMRYIKDQANRTIIRNAKRDGEKKGVRFARIPTGDETCAFCMMLASRGFVYYSEETAEGLNHGHENCDCKIIPGFGDNPSVGGYDHRPYLRFYDDNTVFDEYGHVRLYDTLNNMRLSLYPAYKDRRNELRRKRYAESKKNKNKAE